jgi:hypothetical protein
MSFVEEFFNRLERYCYDAIADNFHILYTVSHPSQNPPHYQRLSIVLH